MMLYRWNACLRRGLWLLWCGFSVYFICHPASSLSPKKDPSTPLPQPFTFLSFHAPFRQDKMSFTESARFVLPNSCSRVWSFMLLHPPRTHSQLEFQQHRLVIKDLDCGVETTRVQVPDQCFICPQAVAPLSFSFLSCKMSMVMVCILLEK